MPLPTVDPEALAVIKALAANVPPWPAHPGIADRRSALEAVFGALPRDPVERTTDVVVPTDDGEVPGRLYAGSRHRPRGLLIFFHGGAWLAGSIESHDGICRILANRSGAMVLSVGYRLAPEHPFPAGLRDAEAAIRWGWEARDRLGAEGGGLAIGGDSAGATLVAVAALSLRGRVHPALQVLAYPATDMRMGSASWAALGDGYLLTRGEVEWSLYQYGLADPTDWRASPLLADDVSRVPPALIITAECDPLRDEAESYGRRLVEASVRVTTHRYPGMIHGFIGLAGLRASELALSEIADAVRHAVGPSAGAS